MGDRSDSEAALARPAPEAAASGEADRPGGAGAGEPGGEEGERRRYHHGDLRAALLAEGEAVLAERGLAGFSLRAVAKRAGVSHAAPAHHFGDARGLLTALAAQGFERLLATQGARAAQAPDDPLERLVASGLGYLDFALAEPVLLGLMFSDRPNAADPDHRRASEAAYRRLSRESAALRPGRAPDDPGAVGDLRIAWSLVHGLSTLVVAGQLRGLASMAPHDRDEAVRALVRRALA